MLNKNFWSQAYAAFHKVIHSAWAYAFVALLALAAVPSAQAATRYWTGGGSDTLWSTSGNWKDNAAPGEGDAAQFRADQVGGAFTGKMVTLRDAYTINVLHVSKGSSASEPIVFEADQNSAHGVTVSDDVWLGYYADGALWLQSGTYTFAKSLNVGVGSKSSTHNFWLKVGDGSSTVSLTAKASNPTIKGASQFVADKATLDFTGMNFNMYNTSAADVKDSDMTARILNVAVNEGNNCTVVFNGGSLTLASASVIGYGKNSTGYMYATNLTFTTGSADLLLGGADSGKTGATGWVDKKGGDWTIGGDLQIGAQGTGTFTADGGSVTVGGNTYIANASGATGTLTIQNGTFTTKSISATGSATLNMDGCTLKAGANNETLINSGITVKVGARGATIDTAGCAVTLAADIGNAEDATGALVFAGGGTVTLSGAANWAGTSTINAGTILAFPAATKSGLVARGITVAIPETGAVDGGTVLEITDGNGTFSPADIAAITLTGNSNNRYALVLADGDAKVTISDTFAGEYVWNGGSSGDSWRTDGNWSKNGTSGNWYDSTAAVFANAGDLATVDDNVGAESVTFRAHATVAAGGGTLAPGTVAVSNGVSATIAAPTAGVLEKTGPGTLTLGSSRSDMTTLSEGTLVMSGSGTTLDWSRLTQGTDATKPVTVKFEGGAALAETATFTIGAQAGMTASVVKEAGDWTVGKVHIGESESSVASFYHNGGTMVISSNFDIGYNDSATSSYFEIAGGTVTNSGYYIHLGANSPGMMTVKAGGKYGVVHTTGLIVGGYAAGTLNVAGGDVFIDGPLSLSYWGGAAAVNVTDGGVLTINKVLHGVRNGTGAATLALDGGTIRANDDSTTFVPDNANVTVKVGANGGTIDVNAKTIALLRPILEDSESTGGGMTFRGGGIVTLAAGNTYTGITTVEVGTAVVVAAPGEIGGGLAVAVPETPPAEGIYTLVAIDGGEAFSASVLTGVAVPANATLRLSGDGKSVLCIYGNPPNTWVGGAAGSLSDGANWSLGVVPRAGDSCIIGTAAAANLTNPSESDFAPSTITFPADTALVTISGEGTLAGLEAVVNNSSQHHVIACPVDASEATPALPLADENYLVFSGGIALDANAMPSVTDMRLAGVWNLTGDWSEPPSGTSIMPNSTVNVSGTLKNGYNIVIEAQATLQAANATADYGATGKNRFLYKNAGTFIVTGEMQDTMLSSGGTYSLVGFFANGDKNGVTRANGLVHSASTKNGHPFRLNNSEDSAANTIVLGAGGLSFRDNQAKASNCYPYFQIDYERAVTLASSADWSFGTNSVPGRNLCLELGGTVTIDTSDYDDRAVPHTITAVGRIGSSGKMIVAGCGKMVFKLASDFSGGLEVKDTATVSFDADCGPTSSSTSVGGGATLEVAECGTVTLGGNLALAAGAALGFNYTGRGTPQLALNGVTFDEGATTNVLVKVTTNGARPRIGGDWKLTSGYDFTGVNVALAPDAPAWAKGIKVDGDGDIALRAASYGFVINVR